MTPLFLPGPMEGVMSPEFIRAANSLHLAERWITPFFRLSQELPKLKHFREFLAPFAPVPTVLQLMGHDPGLLAAAAQRAEPLEIVGIDLNLGCPSRQVTRHGAGSALLKTPKRAAEIVNRVREAVKIPVSVKIRCGWESPEELPHLLEVLSDAGPAMVTLHYRTVAELYREVPGVERARRFRLAAEHCIGRCPLILNGDFQTPEMMKREVSEFGAAGAMAARGLLRDPGLLRRANGLEAEPPEVMRETFFRAVIAQYPEGMPPGRAIELSNFLWGKDNPYFAALAGRKAPVGIPMMKRFAPVMKDER